MMDQLKQLIFPAIENCKDVDLLDLIYKILVDSVNCSEVE